MKTTDWYGLYSSGWGSDLVPEAYSHPAKVRPDLARKIYEHAIEEGWLEAGSIVLDPFGGIAGFALSAMKYGMHWIGIELEQKFVGLGQQNIDLWNARFSQHLPGWGSAVLLRGDSRNLAQVVAEAGAVVSSPPFVGSIAGEPRKDNSVLGQMQRGENKTVGGAFGKSLSFDYGSAPGQLAALPEGDLAAAIGSPPHGTFGCGHDAGHPRLDAKEDARREAEGCNRRPAYGFHSGQLGQMRDGGFAEACVSSPPFEESIASDSRVGKAASYTGHKTERYGISRGQLGQESGDTFWAASRLIVEQVYSVLRPGGHAIFVTKSFIRKGKRVDFPGQWRELCEACGFVTLHQHRAWLVEDRGAQYDLMGELHERKVERKSFFRRLAEKRGSPPIDYEVVWCMQK